MAPVPGLGWPDQAGWSGRPERRRQDDDDAPDQPPDTGRSAPSYAAVQSASAADGSGGSAPAGGSAPGGSARAGGQVAADGLGWPADVPGTALRPAMQIELRDTVSESGHGDSARAASEPVAEPDSAAQARQGRDRTAEAVSRGTTGHRKERGIAVWQEDETEQESETEMAEGRAPRSADQDVAGGGAEADAARITTGAGRHAGPAVGFGSGEAGQAGPAAGGVAFDTPIARAARAALAARGGQAWPRPRSCRIITIANQKGGVGKTTTAVNLAAGLALHGARVLVLDLDPQGNASTALDVEHHAGVVSIYNVLVDGQALGGIVQPVAGIPLLYCAPATIDLAGAEIELVPLVARESRLARAVAGYDASDLDYIFIDCPPSLGLLTLNALVAAPEVLIPIQCEYYALEGLEQLLRTVELVRSHLNPGLAVSTILLTMFDGRTRLAAQVADEVRQHFGEIVLGPVIPRSVRVSEAPSYGQSVMTYDPGSTGAVAYMEAAREMADRNARSGRTS
jgi:chromosome partitioning protein